MTMIDISCSKVFEILAVIDLLKNKLDIPNLLNFKTIKIF